MEPMRKCEVGDRRTLRTRTVVVTTHRRLEQRPMIVPADGTITIVHKRYPPAPTEMQAILGVRGSESARVVRFAPCSEASRSREVYVEYDGGARPAAEWYPPHPADLQCPCQHWRAYMWATAPA